ncbi:zinc finger BED domain-containing protein 1-like [Sparus aurata]|uniref:zinc finger BED domain-containing protein 1-like n=1 Tax=Sparus aurata TaxID=8175 RepID=UPI0011C1B7F4|nr:zinc finger BED domain-containing protein 1-like [Sparus aurata]
MVIWDLQPFSIVEDRGFRAFTKTLDLSYTLPGRKTLSKILVPQLYTSCHDSVKERVGHPAAVCLTTDWTSRTTQSYMSMTCHFLEDYDMVSCLLDCFQFSERHTADNLSDHLMRITREWEIQDKVVACVSDGASNITLAIQKCGWKHLHCFAHTLNLIARGGLKNLSETLEKVKHVVDHFHRSSVSAEKLRDTLAQMGLPDLKLLQDCPIRWNSTFIMLECFAKLKDAIITTLALVNSAMTALTHTEWETIEEACEVLQPFEEVTEEISGESHVTASKINILSSGLQRLTACHLRTGHFKQPVVVSLLSALNSEMAKRFHRIEFTSLLEECSILDPRFKRKAFSNEQAANEEEALVEQGAAGGQPREESMVWGDFDVQVSGLVSHISANTEATLEVRSFLQEALIPRSSNPLTWWKSRCVIYPRLTHLMMEKLCVVATSVPSERVFSKMGQLISEKRSRLSASKVQKLMFFNANLE